MKEYKDKIPAIVAAWQAALGRYQVAAVVGAGGFTGSNKSRRLLLRNRDTGRKIYLKRYPARHVPGREAEDSMQTIK